MARQKAKVKATTPVAQPMSNDQKRTISESISNLSDRDMMKAVQIIRNGCPHLQDYKDEELELDLEDVPLPTLWELWKQIVPESLKRPAKRESPESEDAKQPASRAAANARSYKKSDVELPIITAAAESDDSSELSDESSEQAQWLYLVLLKYSDKSDKSDNSKDTDTHGQSTCLGIFSSVGAANACAEHGRRGYIFENRADLEDNENEAMVDWDLSAGVDKDGCVSFWAAQRDDDQKTLEVLVQKHKLEVPLNRRRDIMRDHINMEMPTTRFATQKFVKKPLPMKISVIQ